MPNLIETYARSVGLKIDKPWIKEDFWPLPFDKFITLSAGSGQAAKNYDYYQIVIDMLNPILTKYNITIVQLGDKDTQLYSGTYDLRGKMTVAQSTGLIKRALAHFGNDSWSAHAAGFIGTPLCALYGTTDKTLHGPHWQDKTKTILLESHRWGRNPTFGAEQSPKSINLIPPEDVTNSILKLLNISIDLNHFTKFIGPIYFHTILDIIPNNLPPSNLGSEIPVTMRMDIEFNESGLLSVLQTGRKVTILTKKPINLNLLASFKQNILSYSHEIQEDCPLDYPSKIRSIIPNSIFFSRIIDEEILSKLRFKFFDSCTIERALYSTKEDFIKEASSYLNKTLDKETNFATMMCKTNKFIFSNGKIYLSYAHLSIDQSVPDLSMRQFQVIDNDLFFQDLNHYLIYANTNTSSDKQT